MNILLIVLIVGIIFIINIVYIFLGSVVWKKPVGILNALLAIATAIIAVLSLDIKAPIVLPLDGMLTEDNPSISMKSETLTSIYYTTDPHIIPAADKTATKYKNPFIPEKSETYYVQSRFLWRTSEIINYTFTTDKDTLNRLGRQTGDSEISVNESALASVSMEKSDSYDSLPDGILCGWGDNAGGRSSYTIDDINRGALNHQIIFNTISDSVIGDEKNFVAATEDIEHEPDEIWYWNANLINVEIGKTYKVRIFGHNNSPEGYQNVAKDVKVKYLIPTETGRTIPVHGMISSSNAVPSLYWDGVVFTCDDLFHLECVEASFNNNLMNSPLSMDVINDWVSVGYDKFDGSIPGCYEYSFIAVVYLKVVGD